MSRDHAERLRFAARPAGAVRPTCAVLLAALVLLSLGACRSAPIRTVDNRIGTGDAVQGQLVGFGSAQTFTFEGVESSLLDFALKSDAPHLAAPEVTIHDPEGNEVDVPLGIRSEADSANLQVKDLFLRRTGTYRVTVRAMTGAEPVFYRFNHRLRFPGQAPYTVRLTSDREHEAVVSIPRGGRIRFRVWPAADSEVKPEVVAVLDPDGERALDPSKRPRGMPRPVLDVNGQGMHVLSFSAPKPGRYTIRTRAAPGKPGVAKVAWTVQGPRRRARQVVHPNRDAPYGLPSRKERLSASTR